MADLDKIAAEIQTELETAEQAKKEALAAFNLAEQVHTQATARVTQLGIISDQLDRLKNGQKDSFSPLGKV